MISNHRRYVFPVLFIFALSITGAIGAEAGSKDLVAGKRVKFEDDSALSMQEVIDRREEEEKEFRANMMNNSARIITLLTEIKDLLMKMNEKP